MEWKEVKNRRIRRGGREGESDEKRKRRETEEKRGPFRCLGGRFENRRPIRECASFRCLV